MLCGARLARADQIKGYVACLRCASRIERERFFFSEEGDEPRRFRVRILGGWMVVRKHPEEDD